MIGIARFAPVFLVAGLNDPSHQHLRTEIAKEPRFRTITTDESDLDGIFGHHHPAGALINDDLLQDLFELRALAVTYPQTGIAVAVRQWSKPWAQRLSDAGACMVIPTTAHEPSYVRTLLVAVASGEVTHPAPILPPVADVLTSRERAVAHLLAVGHNMREVAVALYVTKSTVNTHRRAIYTKLGVHSRTELAEKMLPFTLEQRRTLSQTEAS